MSTPTPPPGYDPQNPNQSGGPDQTPDQYGQPGQYGQQPGQYGQQPGQYDEPGQYGQQPGAYPGQPGQPGQYGQAPGQPGGSSYPSYPQSGATPYGQQPYAGYGYGNPGGELATWPVRVGAFLIDGLIVAVPNWIGSTLTATDNSGLRIVGYLLILVALGLWIYNRIIQQGKTGQSWGKKALGLKLVGADSGQTVGAGKAFLREICHILDSLPCYLGYLWPLWDEKKQTFSDKINSTYVVKL
ncbi:RDD domain containing protein [Kribbella flavida DSM 17836]|uniref:RDD domain containing protein n=1 Tax=Kribbella flavida (strain DSM 17836 / JCM 10339 / NBRC 14399) TaxID=479435 RepID=D2Q065_KRIFD|nr:RDD family protein [Kribbella flavida]ADB30063.1 RDD domain containing protein [Kribbella flavida DSM 17836]